MNKMITRSELLSLDERDPLARFRDAFLLPEGVIYLDGNSLGPLPKSVIDRMTRVLNREWGIDLIRSWNINDWIRLPRTIGDKLAQLLGANPGEVIAADSTSINLFKLLVAALALRPGRGVILSDVGNFPTDLYMAQGVAKLLGDRHVLRLVKPEEVADAIDETVAVVMLTHVDYRTGRIHNMAGITEAAHSAGAIALWDLAHSAGAVPIDLHGCGVELAIGCTYKYLNGGPGAPAFLYVAEALQSDLQSPLSGWMGHAAPFAFDLDYQPAPGIARHLCGTPPVLSMAALDSALDLMLEADMALVRKKSQALTDWFIRLVEQECSAHGFALASPRDASQRGSQVSLRHDHGHPIMSALISRGVIGDFRAPDVLRCGFAPLYLRYQDVWDAVATLKSIMDSRAWDAPEHHKKATVT